MEKHPGPSSEPKRLRFSFRRKVSLTGLLLAGGPLIGVSLALLDINRSAVELQSRELQLAVIDDVARTVAATTAEAQSNLSAVASIMVDATLTGREAERLALSVLGGTDSLDHVAVYDVAGKHVDTLRKRDLKGLAVGSDLQRDCRTAAVTHGLCTQDVVVGPGGPRLPMAVPLRVDGEVRGFVESDVPLAPLQARIDRLAELRFASQPDSLFVVDQRLRLLAHSDHASPNLAAVEKDGFLTGMDPRVLAHPLNLSGEYEAGGQAMVGTLVSLPQRGWAVVAQLPRSLVYASVSRMRAVVVTTVAAVLLLVAFAAFVVGRWVSRPVAILTDFAGRLAARDFGARVSIASGDEFEYLSNAMSQSAHQLQESEAKVRKEMAIRADLGRYLPVELVDRVIARKQAMDLGGTRRQVTVMFADVVAFTPLTERLSPETTVALLNELFTVLTEIVFRNGGMIDKFIGDCVMALWGATDLDESGSDRALEAAGEMLSWLATINESFQERYGAQVQLAIGIHAGEAVVGNIGSKTRMEYTVIGDTVNLAAQLESIARPSQILVSQAVRERAGTGFSYVDLGSRDLPGREHPVHLYEVRP